ncbi:MAG TPA: type IV toxin-antitoxin system AbiEi family antitoxin domain-containing protein [Solirubrobacterales bacterium]|nr:type IV toxin-antitoxin system AbiEi family antitoxin domain-containing protein [Solirubrobacterales bacterium]
MGRVSHTAALAATLNRLAERQHGVVSGTQMRQIGFTDDRIESWARRGHIHRLLRGVYAVGQQGIDERGRIQAAALACGPGTVVSDRSAAFLLRIGERLPRVIDVIVPRQQGREIHGIRVHAVPPPSSHELLVVHGIRCTNVARTIVDLAGTYGEKGLGETFGRAATEGVLDLAAIDAILDGGPRRRGAPCLRRVIAAWRPAAEIVRYATVRSLFEAKLLPLIAAAGIPLPRINAPVRTARRILEVDLLWDAERFIVEADSRRHHGTEIAFERDRKRDRELMAARYTVLRVTWREVEHETEAVFAAVRGELGRRGNRRSAANGGRSRPPTRN